MLHNLWGENVLSTTTRTVVSSKPIIKIQTNLFVGDSDSDYESPNQQQIIDEAIQRLDPQPQPLLTATHDIQEPAYCTEKD